MFKPSLRKSILNDNLCIESQKKHTLFEASNQIKERPVYRKQLVGGESREIVDIPSMMISERLLTRTTFEMDHHPDTKVFTPFTYDFRAYPRAVREFIAHNPNAAQAGKCGEINFVIYEKCLFLWVDNKSNKIPTTSSSFNTSPSLSPSQPHKSEPNILLKMHKFSEPIDIAEFSIIKNTKIFTTQKAIVLAIVFKNRMKLFIVNEKELSLEDMMLKYQLKGANKIQHVYFTNSNEIIFTGDNGKLSMISLNGNTSHIITVHQSSFITKYLSRSAFDYSTVYNIREITSSNGFVYCLYDRIRKGSYLLYVLKKAVNKVVKLEHEPKHVVDETFVDVYKINKDNNDNNENNNNQIKTIRLVDRISQQLVEQKVKEGYSQFTGENIKDGFRIVAVRGRANGHGGELNNVIKPSHDSNKLFNKSKDTEMRVESEVKSNDKLLINGNDGNVNKNLSSNVNGVLEIVTKCGYVIGVVHATDDNVEELEEIHRKNNVQNQHSLEKEGDATQNNISLLSSHHPTHISFTHQPYKLPSIIGPSHFLEPKIFPSVSAEKSYRKNFVIKAIRSNNNLRELEKNDDEEMVLLLSDSLMRITQSGEVNVVRFGDLKVGVMETTTEKEMFITKDEYEKKYNNKFAVNKAQQSQQPHTEPIHNKTLFPHHTSTTQKPTHKNEPQKYYRLFNTQRRFTAFDNEGRIDVYTLELRHSIIAYISHYLEAKARAESDTNNQHSTLSMLNGAVDYDYKMENILSKIIHTYGYCKTIKSLIEILTLNHLETREYIHFQRSLLIDTIRKEFESEEPSPGSRFEEWNYLLNHHEESYMIVVNDAMLEYVWSMVFEWHLRAHLSREVVKNISLMINNIMNGKFQSSQWVDDMRAQEAYTAYGNALQSLFSEQLSILSSLRAREFKEHEPIIRSCQSNLIKLHEFIEHKNKKALYYRSLKKTYEHQQNKMSYNFSPNNKQMPKTAEQSLTTSTFNDETLLTTTTYHMLSDDESSMNKAIFGSGQEGEQLNNYSYSTFTQANSIVESSLLKSIEKIVTLVDVMNLLIEKDERQKGVPSFLSILTDLISQIKCGELLYNEELLLLNNETNNNTNNTNNTNHLTTATFLHPELIQRVLRSLPELELDKKIEFLKFKLSRNLIYPLLSSSSTDSTNTNNYNTTTTTTTKIDLKSLDLNRLSKLISSSDLPELNKIFLMLSEQQHDQQQEQSNRESNNLSRAEYYIEFLTICLNNLIAKTNQLVDIKESKFNSLSSEIKQNTTMLEQQEKLTNTKGILTNYYSVDKIIMAEQKLSYFQAEMVVFYQEVIKVFKSSVDYLTKITGQEYYEAEKYLERIIEMLVCTFPNEEVLIQTIKIILKDANMIDKVQYVRTTRKRMDDGLRNKRRVFVDLSGDNNEGRLTEKSTFEYLLKRNNEKNLLSNHHDRTIDTWRNVDHNNSIEERRVI